MKFAEFNVFVLGIQDQLELVSGKEQHLVLCFRVYYVLWPPSSFKLNWNWSISGSLTKFIASHCVITKLDR